MNTLLHALLLFAILVLGSAGCATQPPTAASPRLRVMTFNLHHGEGMDGRVDLERIAGLIKRERVDLVGLQEVDKGTARTDRMDFPAELARLTGFTCVFSNNLHYQGGEYGNAILSRFPIRHWQNHHYQMLRPNEQRGVLQAVLTVHGREIVFLNTHIDHRPDDAERWSNVAEIEAVVRQFAGKPIILCGDFNTTPDTRVYRRLAQTLNDAWTSVTDEAGFTFPVKQPTKRIDFIWFQSGAALEPARAWVPQTEASDHLPVVVEFVVR